MGKIIIEYSFISFIFLAGISHCFSQNTVYHPFPTGYAFWVDAEGYYPNFSSIEYVVMNGDTEINGLTYQKIYTTPFDTGYSNFLAYFMREDSNKQVYLLTNTVGISPEDHLYDFNLSLNDTFWFTAQAWDDTFPALVTKVDTIQTLIDTRRRLKIESANPDFPLWGYQDNSHYWIEGIGSTLGLDGYTHAPFNVPDEAPYFQLLCFWDSGEYVLASPYGCFFTGLAEINSEKFVFSISPNPVNDHVNIISPAFLSETLFISIVSMTGNLIFSKEGIGQIINSINIGNLPTGFYLVKITDEQNRPVFTAPFVKQ